MDRGDAQSRRNELEERLGRLNEFWGAKTLAEISGETCGAYVRERGTVSGARRDLEDLRAAIGHHAKEGYHQGSVRVSLPPKGLPRDRWLTRSEAAKLLWACWSTRETQRAIPTVKFPLRHIARFILIGLYTGTRAAAIAASAPARAEGRAYVDLERGVFYRLAIGKRVTNKRQPPVPLPPQLLSHMRRWARIGLAGEYFVTWHGKRSGRPVWCYSTHVAPHGSDVAHAKRRSDLGSGRVSWHVARNARQDLRPSSPRPSAECGAQDRLQKRGCVGCSIGGSQKTPRRKPESLIKIMVGVRGFEPQAPSSRIPCSA